MTGFRRKQVAGGDELHVVVGSHSIAPRALALVQVRHEALEHLGLVQELLVALGGLVRLVYPALDHFHVRHDELEVDDLNVARGVRAALDVDDVLIIEAAHNVDDGVRVADVGQELVAQALALGRRPCTRPAMSTNSMTAGVYFFGSYISAS